MAEGGNPNVNLTEDEEMENRLSMIFTESLVVVNERADRRQSTTFTPSEYNTNIATRLKKYQDGFHQRGTREDFVADTLKETGTTIKIENNQVKAMVSGTLNVMDKADIKSWHPVTVVDVKHGIPLVHQNKIPKYVNQFEVIVSAQYKALAAAYEATKRQIDIRKTHQCIRNFAYTALHGATEKPERMFLAMKIVEAIVLEQVINQANEQAKDMIQCKVLIDDDLSNGMYIDLNPSIETRHSHRTTMIQDTALSTSLNTVYNLSFEQMITLRDYLFKESTIERMEAKIRLLSGAHLEVRNDIATSPEAVFKTALAEHFMSRTEIFELMFYERDPKTRQTLRRCPSCKTTLPSGGFPIPHNRCSVIEWLIKHTHGTHEDGNYFIREYAYLSAGTSTYVRSLYGLKTRLQTNPYISKTEDEFVAYVTDERGRPRKVASIGSRQVKLAQ